MRSVPDERIWQPANDGAFAKEPHVNLDLFPSGIKRPILDDER